MVSETEGKIKKTNEAPKIQQIYIFMYKLIFILFTIHHIVDIVSDSK